MFAAAIVVATWVAGSQFKLAEATASLVQITDESAVCLDGSPAAFYLQPGSAGNQTWVFMLEGGGLCSHELDCKARTKTDLGSSKNFADTIQLPAFQSSSPVDNPDWFGANMVFVPYCSGDLHGGNRNTTSKDTWGLHFAGHIVIDAMITQLKSNNGLGTADLVIFAGGSAGGIGVFYNIDHVSASLPGVKILGVPIGGYLFMHPTYKGPDAQHDPETSSAIDFERDAELFDSFAAQNNACSESLGPGNAWRCGSPATLYPYISTPLLIIESQIDSVIMFGFSDVPEENISEVTTYAKAFRRNSTIYADHVVQSSKDSIFSVCCFMHTNFARGSPTIEGVDYYDLLGRSARAIVNGSPLPSSLVDRCAGLQCGENCPQFP